MFEKFEKNIFIHQMHASNFWIYLKSFKLFFQLVNEKKLKMLCKWTHFSSAVYWTRRAQNKRGCGENWAVSGKQGWVLRKLGCFVNRIFLRWCIELVCSQLDPSTNDFSRPSFYEIDLRLQKRLRDSKKSSSDDEALSFKEDFLSDWVGRGWGWLRLEPQRLFNSVGVQYVLVPCVLMWAMWVLQRDSYLQKKIRICS